MQNNDPKTILKNLSLIYGALFLGMLLFLVIASLVVSNSGALGNNDQQTNQILKWVVIALSVGGIPLAFAVPQKMIKSIDKSLSLTEKLKKYQQALIIRFAITEGSALLTTFAFLFTGDTDLILLLAIILLFYIISRPNPFKAATDLELSQAEKARLYGSNPE